MGVRNIGRKDDEPLDLVGWKKGEWLSDKAVLSFQGYRGRGPVKPTVKDAAGLVTAC